MEAFFEVEADGIFVTDTITDDMRLLDRANELYTSMRKRVGDNCPISLRLLIRTRDIGEIVINLR